MTELEQAMAAAFAGSGQQSLVNRFHRLFLQSIFFLPIDQNHPPSEEEPFRPLFIEHEQNIFMLVFDSQKRATAWAGDVADEIHCIEISGRDLIASIGESVYLILNAGAKIYKEFSPDEIKYLKKVVARIEQLK